MLNRYGTLIGTVLLAALGPKAKEKLNSQQVAIVTPRTAEAMGLSYETLWEACGGDEELPHGSPIVVRLAPEGPAQAAALALEKAAPTPEKNIFIRA